MSSLKYVAVMSLGQTHSFNGESLVMLCSCVAVYLTFDISVGQLMMLMREEYSDQNLSISASSEICMKTHCC